MFGFEQVFSGAYKKLDFIFIHKLPLNGSDEVTWCNLVLIFFFVQIDARDWKIWVIPAF